jgi:hypothetical protein
MMVKYKLKCFDQYYDAKPNMPSINYHTKLQNNIHTYIHTKLQKYIHTYIYTYKAPDYLHTCMHEYQELHTYIHTYIHAKIQATYTHIYMYIYIYIYICTNEAPDYSTPYTKIKLQSVSIPEFKRISMSYACTLKGVYT